MSAEYMYVFAKEDGKNLLKIYEGAWDSDDWKKIETKELKIKGRVKANG